MDAFEEFKQLRPMEAILLWTTLPANGQHPDYEENEPILVTTKLTEVLYGACLTYLWACGILHADPDSVRPEPHNLSPKESFSEDDLDRAISVFFDQLGRKISRKRHLRSDYDHIGVWHVIDDTLEQLGQELGKDPDEMPHPMWAEGKASFSLSHKGLIEDPITITGTGAEYILLGIVPYHFNKRTTRGDNVIKEVKAILWQYKTTRDKEGRVIASEFNIPLVKSFRKHVFGFIRDWFDDDKEHKK